MSDAGEAGVATLSDGDVSAGQLLVNVGGNQDCDAANLLLHLLGVDLTHVAATVRLLDLAQMQLPDLNKNKIDQDVLHDGG